ncbi:MAG TPA: hypothetical protein VGY98_07860 [Verrucomicrobiae bacterium]|nr:hypothetical protein [Verrucomicrobiae bacterium]
MNPDFLTDGGADFRFNAFSEAHAAPAEFIGWLDWEAISSAVCFTLLRQ